jgi:hypothetical protein
MKRDRSDTPAVKKERYEWIGKENTRAYMNSITKWKIHSNTSNFTQQFEEITTGYSDNNELRTIKLEEFLIAEAKKAGVIKT